MRLSTWYRNIEELPLHIFIKAQVEKDVRALIISGNPSIEDLSITWNDLVLQYNEAIGDTKTTMLLFIYKELALLAITVREIDLLITALRKRYNAFFHQQLNLICECDFPLSECQLYSSAYHNLLDRYEKRSKGIRREIKIKEMEYDALQEGGEGPAPTRAYYDCVLITLTDFSKVPIDDRITVFVYCERVRRLNAYCKKMNK